MRALRQTFNHGEVPVPEVFGWRAEDGTNFIEMSLVPGERLGDAWPSLPAEEKESIICDELGSIQAQLRRLRPDSPETFIGM